MPSIAGFDRISPELIDPFPGDNPAGEDLCYSLEYQAVEEPFMAQLDGRDVPAAQWSESFDRALALATRTRDIVLATLMARAAAQLGDIARVAFGFALAAELAERFWPRIYPELEEEDSTYLRIVLRVLASEQTMLTPLRAMQPQPGSEWREALATIRETGERIVAVTARDLVPGQPTLDLSPLFAVVDQLEARVRGDASSA